MSISDLNSWTSQRRTLLAASGGSRKGIVEDGAEAGEVLPGLAGVVEAEAAAAAAASTWAATRIGNVAAATAAAACRHLPPPD